MDGPPDPGAALPTRTDLGPTALRIPQQLGAVQLIGEIGRGAMGVVWRGHDRMLGRPVAVKFLLEAVSGPDDPGFQRFLDGARAAAAVRHAALVTVFQADLHEGAPYLVMELVEGPTLDELVRRFGPLPAPAALAAMADIAAAVGALHAREIVHRDIKSSNVLIDAGGRPHVTDFGLACSRPAAGGRVAGTPAYMAPEMFAGAVSPRSDVYALGVLCFELLAGDVPFRGDFGELGRQHADTPPPLERLRAAGVPAALVEIVERALHKNALFRFKSAEALGRAYAEVPRETVDPTTGRRTLATLVERWRTNPAAAERRPAPNESAYYGHLGQRAALRRDGLTAASAAVEPSSSAPRPVAGTAVMGTDLACIPCGYNLRGLPAAGACPECGTPVADAVFERRLLFADRAWLRQTAQGLRWVNASLGWIVALAVGLPILLSLMLPFLAKVPAAATQTTTSAVGLTAAASAPSTATRSHDTPILRFIENSLPFVWVGLVAAFAYGVIRATAAEPGQHRSADALYRVAGRYALLAGVGLWTFGGRLPPVVHPAIDVAEALLLAGGAALTVRYWSGLVARIPIARVARNGRNVAVFLGLVALMMAAAACVPRSALPIGVGELLGLGPLAAVLGFLAYFSLAGRLRRALRDTVAGAVSRANLFR